MRKTAPRDIGSGTVDPGLAERRREHAQKNYARRPGTPDDFGTWTLILPGGRELSVRLDPVPTFDCFDHRYETHGYQPSDLLRHLVQIRDGTCTFPPCNRHARDSDFEHAVPYEKGGKTCACNAGARSQRAVAPATRSSNHPAGTSPSQSPAGIDGRPQPAASTRKNQSDTPPDPDHPPWLRRPAQRSPSDSLTLGGPVSSALRA